MTSDSKTVSKSGPVAFFRQVRQELNRITWPSRKEATVSTIMVFIMAAISAVFLFVADQVIAYIIQFILG